MLAALPVSVFAAEPLKGSVYRGALSPPHAKVAISFRVSAAGEVWGLRLSALPIYCSGSGPPGTPSIAFAPVKVSAGGSFTGTGEDLIASGRLKGGVVASFTVSGTFQSGGAERGRITTSYGGAAKRCSGRSAYSTHA